MTKTFKGALAAVLLAGSALAGPALAQDDGLKVGLVLTLSGPAAVLGEQARNGFMLALEDMGGTLGGVPTEVTVVDDELKPDVAATRARELVERDGADFVVGPIFSNILLAIAKPVTDAGAFLVSPNAGTSNFAGAECNPNLFVVSYQNDQPHEVSGKYAQDQGYQRLFLMAPNYQAGKDALAGVKNSFKGEVVAELYPPLGQLDFSAELAQIAAFQPDAVYAFMPGGMGVNLVKQYRQAGLEGIPFLSAFTVDETTLPAQQDAAVGFFGGANWAPDFDNEKSKAFVAAYEAKYGAVPGTYAMQAYDAAQLIASAVEKAGTGDADALRAALKEADFESLRGEFRFGDNFETRISQKIFDDYQDNYAAQCTMQ
jgi:branched-chain amino acid transport system substrate-binding protein